MGSFTSYFNIETNYETNYETKTKKEHNTNSFSGTEAAYLKGHVVLEKEIELIQSRKVEDFIPDLARIDFLQAELLKNKEVKSVEMMLAKTPIGTDQFSAAVYNLDTLVYKNNTKTSLILALSIVLGGMLGIFVLLIRNVLIKQD